MRPSSAPVRCSVLRTGPSAPARWDVAGAAPWSCSSGRAMWPVRPAAAAVAWREPPGPCAMTFSDGPPRPAGPVDRHRPQRWGQCRDHPAPPDPGTGLRGLGDRLPSGDVIRPLLSVSRIEAYLRFWGLPWREDSTNRDDAYTRNRLRHRVLPELEAMSPACLPGWERWPPASGRTRPLMEQAQAALAPLEELPGAVPPRGGGGIAAAPGSAGGPQPLGRMEHGNENCSAAHLEGLVSLCRSGDPSAELSLPGGVTATGRTAV